MTWCRVQASLGPRSYNILLTERALKALDAAEVELTPADSVRTEFFMRHRCGEYDALLCMHASTNSRRQEGCTGPLTGAEQSSWSNMF